jgi:hypothetical protein
MGGKSSDVKETPAQRAAMEYAVKKFADYKQRYLPLQMRMAEQIKDMKAFDSGERMRARGRASTETAARFSQAQSGLESALTASGAGPGSSKFKLATTGMGDDLATAQSMGLTSADQAIDNAYVEGLTALQSIGQGKDAAVSNAIDRQAAMSAQEAQFGAEMAARNRAGNRELVGTALGYGLSRAMPGPNTPAPSFHSKSWWKGGEGFVGE